MSKFVLEDYESNDPAFRDLREAYMAVEKLGAEGKLKLFRMLCIEYPDLYRDAGPRWDQAIPW